MKIKYIFLMILTQISTISFSMNSLVEILKEKSLSGLENKFTINNKSFISDSDLENFNRNRDGFFLDRKNYENFKQKLLNEEKLNKIRIALDNINHAIEIEKTAYKQGNMLEYVDFQDMFKSELNIINEFEKKSIKKNKMIFEAVFYMINSNYQNIEILKLFLENGFKDYINSEDKEEHVTPLLYACKNNNLFFVDFLLKNGASNSLYSKNNNLETPLHIACKSGNKDIITLLIQFINPKNLEAYINTPNYFGETPVSIAKNKHGMLLKSK